MKYYVEHTEGYNSVLHNNEVGDAQEVYVSSLVWYHTEFLLTAKFSSRQNPRGAYNMT